MRRKKNSLGEDGRLDEVTLRSVALTSEKLGSSLIDTRLDVSRNSVVLKLRSSGTLERVLFEGGSDLDRLDLGGELLEEFVVDGLLNEDPRSGAATLTGVEAKRRRGDQFGSSRKMDRETTH